MNMGQAVSSVFHKYAVFSGRARRSEYWYFFLFNVMVSVVMAVIDAVIDSRIPGLLVSLALLLPGLAVLVRRLHDTSRTGWWFFIVLVPIVGVIVLIVFTCQDSHGDNQYGPSPKAIGGPQAYGQPGYAS
ncbi:DUF805 domain-containing protein [uncultured Jatrophihabitans sp.]|uniref:DUF805 domain-containing protein n=1 Tax=uncultured Jatrophihabitans sp. TaxID=1610747 RepID=UPI0035C9CF2E